MLETRSAVYKMTKKEAHDERQVRALESRKFDETSANSSFGLVVD